MDKTLHCLCGHEETYEIIEEAELPQFPRAYNCKACQSIIFEKLKLKEKKK